MKKIFKSFLDKDGLSQRLLLLSLGFGMTYFVRNWITGEFQKRQFDYEHGAQLQGSEAKAATKIFEETSKMSDKRLYRMRKLCWTMSYKRPEWSVQEQMDNYRKMLFEWNDNFNRNRALIQRYFGEDVKNEFTDVVHQGMKEAGSKLEDYYYATDEDRKNMDIEKIDDDLDEIERRVYDLNLKMIDMIHDKKVGVYLN